MAKNQKPAITIVGAGPAGCFLAILLALRGHTVEMYERSAKKELTDIASKRSFNITIYGYAVQVLKEAGLWDEIAENILELTGAYTEVKKHTTPIYTPMDQEKMPYYSVQRARILEILVKQALRLPQITIHFDTALLSIDRNKKTLLIRNEKSGKIAEIPAEVIIGADGAHSLVRAFLQQGQETTHTQEYASWSYKQIMFSKAAVEKLQLDPNASYTWSRKESVILSFPNIDGSRAAFITMPKEGFQTLNTAAAIKRLIKEHYPTLQPALSDIVASLLHNPEGNFVTIHTSPWYYKDFMTVIGDAAHGFNPFFGQGTSAAFGDAITLVKRMDTHGKNWGTIFQTYQELRKKSMDMLGELSKQGFIRYRRTNRADYSIIYEHFEEMLHKLLPTYFQPSLYEQITKDPGKTAEIIEKHQKQRKLTQAIGGSVFVAAVTGAVALKERFIAKK